MVNFTRSISIRVGNKKRKPPSTTLLSIALEVQVMQFSKKRNISGIKFRKKKAKQLSLAHDILLIWKIQEDQLKNIFRKRENSIR